MSFLTNAISSLSQNEDRFVASLAKAWLAGDDSEEEELEKDLPNPKKHRTPTKFNASVQDGIITLDSGISINLIEIQRVLCDAFAIHGETEYASAVNDLSLLTGIDADF